MSSDKPIVVLRQNGYTLRYARGADSSSSAQILFLGLGQSGPSFLTVARHTPPGMSVVEAFPYSRFPAGKINQFGIESIRYVIESLGSERRYDIYAESQAAAVVVEASDSIRGCLRSLTLIGPLGFNYDHLGSTDRERLSSLLRRSRRFWAHPNQRLSIKGNRDTARAIFSDALSDVRRIKKDYLFGANQNIARTAAHLAQTIPVTIYADKHDSLFPHTEIADAVKGSRITLIQTDNGSHLNRATPKGLAALAAIIAPLA